MVLRFDFPLKSTYKLTPSPRLCVVYLVYNYIYFLLSLRNTLCILIYIYIYIFIFFRNIIIIYTVTLVSSLTKSSALVSSILRFGFVLGCFTLLFSCVNFHQCSVLRTKAHVSYMGGRVSFYSVSIIYRSSVREEGGIGSRNRKRDWAPALTWGSFLMS